jgi:hypothetical protein
VTAANARPQNTHDTSGSAGGATPAAALKPARIDPWQRVGKGALGFRI